MLTIPKVADIPAAELARTLDDLARSYRDHPASGVVAAYRAAGCTVFASPYDKRIADAIVAAIAAGTPYSVVRIGDGEGNLLAHGHFEGTPSVDLHCFAASIFNQEQQFRLTEDGIALVSRLMWEAVEEADIVGVRGTWSGDVPPAGWLWPKWLRRALARQLVKGHGLRGVVGVSRGCEIMLRQRAEMARRGQIVASAHLYLALVRHLPQILKASRRVVCITSRPAVVERLAQAMPQVSFEAIHTGPDLRKARPKEPAFLDAVAGALDEDLRGTLCLVGAGIWSEVYCTWVKRRGGVGVDIGSGFDLLDGVRSRAIHGRVPARILAPARAAGLAAATARNGE